jgi:hypothetical protein
MIIPSLRQSLFQMTEVLREYFRVFAAERLLTVIAARERTGDFPPNIAVPEQSFKVRLQTR